jgi:hypothetical protein
MYGSLYYYENNCIQRPYFEIFRSKLATGAAFSRIINVSFVSYSLIINTCK